MEPSIQSIYEAIDKVTGARRAKRFKYELAVDSEMRRKMVKKNTVHKRFTQKIPHKAKS